jgi:hypothetical protein
MMTEVCVLGDVRGRDRRRGLSRHGAMSCESQAVTHHSNALHFVNS